MKFEEVIAFSFVLKISREEAEKIGWGYCEQCEGAPATIYCSKHKKCMDHHALDELEEDELLKNLRTKEVKKLG